ncbi:hypothetical protein JAAARDRAFT_198529 [Jaapia argillacea MUCL 33604]|uniref:Uncharacterized protein n=1 Tax=Jaapia argillacea MUCL 33604 TaxID=933084 RepID=A0A067PM11_9AGAM|nr:hypothetical protein JAAARDRAFT_198529 [Jaapia argillacea MUCL 33604]
MIKDVGKQPRYRRPRTFYPSGVSGRTDSRGWVRDGHPIAINSHSTVLIPPYEKTTEIHLQDYNKLVLELVALPNSNLGWYMPLASLLTHYPPPLLFLPVRFLPPFGQPQIQTSLHQTAPPHLNTFRFPLPNHLNSITILHQPSCSYCLYRIT